MLAVLAAAAAAAGPDECGCQEVLMTMWILQAGGAVVFIGAVYLAYRAARSNTNEGDR